MGAWWRHGAISDMFETIITLALLGFFALAAYGFIATNANGEAFYARFYAMDVSSTAELVNAGAGDVVLRYDNIKPNLDISFWVDNGKIEVGRTTASGLQPSDARQVFYGLAIDYPTGAIMLTRPEYLVLRKSGESFAITQAETVLASCPTMARKAVPISEAVVSINITKAPTGTYAAEAQQAFGDILSAVKVVQQDDTPNIIFDITVVTDQTNSVAFGPTSDHGAAFDCVFADQLKLISNIPFVADTPTTVAGAPGVIRIPIAISAKNDVFLRPEQLGIALANSLAIYYRGGITPTTPKATSGAEQAEQPTGTAGTTAPQSSGGSS
ncbi:TPA: hypothetical protein HA251_01095 [Candidatus Woesearchaeota archaeon]|nr:hypothetical protein [Candidatus Woesearchaeota archaeon]